MSALNAAAFRRTQPLAGIRVLDLSRLIGGALTTLKLADLGADVVKVEEPGRGDYLREIPPFVDGDGLNNALLNSGKRSIELDLREERDRATLDRLVAVADVVVEVSRPGRWLELGVDLRRWQDTKPALTICSVTGFGQTGDLAPLPSHGMNIDALAGAMPVIADAGGRLVIGSDVALGLELGALNAVVAILASVIEARSTGTGRMIDISCWDAAVNVHRLDVAHRTLTGRPAITPRELGAFYDVYRTSDGETILFCAIEQKFWLAFCEAAGVTELNDHWESSSTVDYGTDPALHDQLAALFVTRSADDWQRLFAASGVPGCLVVDDGDVLRLPHFDQRELTEQGSGARRGFLADPIRWGDGSRPGHRRTPAPALGAHSQQILDEWLADAKTLGNPGDLW